jgi:hypothetical protein
MLKDGWAWSVPTERTDYWRQILDDMQTNLMNVQIYLVNLQTKFSRLERRVEQFERSQGKGTLQTNVAPLSWAQNTAQPGSMTHQTS